MSHGDNIGWAKLGYANQRVVHFYREGGGRVYAHSLCHRMVIKKYLYPEGNSGLPKCKRCTKKTELEKKA